MTGGMDGRAEDRGRVYQASGDQHISEHHHHGAEAAAPGGPDYASAPTTRSPSPPSNSSPAPAPPWATRTRPSS
ncbi:hypothetical protein DDJ31_11325 [Streptomyces griseoviridis]|uniref:Uncharacterized protein n=1 Tax=Streptomyces griseoviridis TaxID=45398 RepID=A0ABX5TV99_STRGD|nr:hypothetical protein DDJ31_11325 [Streptomyces griseoviridis]